MLKITFADVDKLQQAVKDFAGNAEEAINEVLHGEGGALIQEAIQRLIPVSGRKRWKGKAPAAASSNSLRIIPANLAVTVTTAKRYQYLYFPNDGTNTRRHAGQQFFFERGGEAVKDDIIDRCVSKLTNNFEKGV